MADPLLSCAQPLSAGARDRDRNGLGHDRWIVRDVIGIPAAQAVPKWFGSFIRILHGDEVDSLCLVCRDAKVGSAIADDARLWFAGRGKLHSAQSLWIDHDANSR
jgi:hypothetical protein